MIHVVLIHGTFARNAPWTAPGAPLELALRPVIGTGGRFIRFEWSGRNSFNARARAIADLSSLLRSIVESDPGARLYIVAHSHGGNIALQATREKPAVDRIEGLVCLATPVITSTPIQQNLHGIDFLTLFLPLTFALFVIVAFVYLGFRFFGDIETLRHDQKMIAYGIMISLATAAIVAGSVGGVFAAIRVSDRLDGWVRRRSDFILQQTRSPEVGPNRVIFLRHQGDEASALAGAIHLASWVAGASSEVLNQISRAGASLLNRALDWNWAHLAGAVVAGALGIALGSAGSVVLVGILLAPLALGTAAVAVTFLLRGLATAILASFFGFELLGAGTAVRLTVESSPPGAWRVVTLSPQTRAEGPDQPFPYAHGRVHEHPRFLGAVTGWIEASIATASLAMQREPGPQRSVQAHGGSEHR